MMATVTIHSVKEFIENLDLLDDLFLYRGQSRLDWPLVPSIARLNNQVEGYSNWHALEDDLLETFRKNARPYLDHVPNNEYEWILIAQHYGLPTRVLDWTTNPLKGLFFAVENPAHTKDGGLWALGPKGWWRSLEQVNDKIDIFESLAIYYPDHINERIVAQESAFTFFPLPVEHEPFIALGPGEYQQQVDNLLEFRIPMSAKESLRRELNVLGINHQSIFPSLEGLATRIRREWGVEW